MKVKKLYKSIAAAICLATVGQGVVSCSDTWDDHYEMGNANGTASLLQLVENRPELSDFLALLRATHVYNNNHSTSVTFADLLNADQTLTVWAPLDGTYNADSLLELCQTAQGDSTVGTHFVMNHVAHNLYNMNGQTSENVRMLNDKFLTLTSSALYNAEVVAGEYNKPAKNGLLHVVNDDAQYTYNLYEGLTSMEDFSHIGDFMKHYEEQKLDENRSIQSGLVDGKKVYSDSVMVRENKLFRTFDQINAEDSTFMMLVPDKETWQPVYDEAASYFNYGSAEKADSMCAYWANVSLIRDLIYNVNVQRSEEDSVFSTSYSKFDWPYHVFYEPLEAGGVWDPANTKSTLQCSNGEIRRIAEWPFKPEDLYFRPLTTQGEWDGYRKEYKDCTFNNRGGIKADSISGDGYTVISGANENSQWSVTYEVRNTLSGTYDICVVVLPLTVYNKFNNNWRQNKFTATLSYMDLDGELKTMNFPKEDDEDWPDHYVINDSHKVDTVKVGRFTFPTCNYSQQDATVSLTLNCIYNGRNAQEKRKYKNEMYLDCILFKPVSKEEAKGGAEETKRRKEAQK